MKKSISYWSFPGGLDGSKPVAEAFAQAKSAGFEAVEVCLSETGDVSLASSDADLERVKQAAEDKGIEIASVACGLYWQWSLTSSNPATRARAMEISRKLLSTAAALGTDAVLVVPGAVDVFFDPSAEVVSYAEACKRSTEAIGALLPDAESAEVVIGVENVWNKFLLSPMEIEAFVDQFKSPWVGAYFDVGNCMFIGYPADWIRVLGKRIKRVHFKDFRRDVGTAGGFVDLLAGDVEWPDVIKALKEVGYDGPVTAEMIPGYKHYPEVLIENTSRAMDAILGR